jgi:hypothetical protein
VRLKDLEERPESVGPPSGTGRFIGNNTCNATSPFTLAPAYHKHVNQLWDCVHLQGIQRRYPRLVVVLKGLPQPFADWSTDQRYGPDGVVTDEAMGRHRQAAARVLGSVGLNGTRGEA